MSLAATAQHIGMATLSRTPFPRALRALQRRKLTVLMYHDPSAETFRRHVHALRDHYTLVPLASLLDARRCATLPDYALAITVDDGHLRNRDLLTVVKDEGVPLTIFLCTDIVGTARKFWFRALPAGVSSERFKRMPNRARL